MTDDLMWHRIQFAFTITYHYLFPQLTMGLALIIVVLKIMALRKGDERCNEVCQPQISFFPVSSPYDQKTVRRAKACIFSGCESRPATVVPAGSSWSDDGSNEIAEAFDATGRYWRLSE